MKAINIPPFFKYDILIDNYKIGEATAPCKWALKIVNETIKMYPENTQFQLKGFNFKKSKRR